MRSAAMVAAVAVLGIASVPACQQHGPVGGHGAKGGECAPLAAGGGRTAAAGAPTDTGPPAVPDDTVHVDLSHAGGAANRDLTGVVWNAGGSIEPLAAAHPAEVRIDAGLQDRSQGPGQLDLQPLLDRVAQVRAVGAEPLILLSYMPRWLGQPRAGAGNNATRMGPYDLDAWQDLVTQVVRGLATAPQPAYRFEVWNEPDLPIFWQDTPDQFVAMAVRTHRAVAAVEAETHLPLEVGGPAAALPLNANMVRYLRTVAQEGLPLDFVTWHKYANTPFLGPDGPEGNIPESIYRLLAGKNPDATPLDYSAEIAGVRAQVDAAVAGSGLDPALSIDEWNVSAGGYDLRHDSAEGAALVAGTLVEMERAGLDRADFYRAISGGEDHPGDWGLVHADGAPKPSWWVFRAWSTMTGARLATSGDDASTGLWARATLGRGCVSVLLANFVATGAPERTVALDLQGQLPLCRGPRSTTLATLDGSSTSLADAHQVRLAARSVSVDMAPQSVALLQISC